MEKTKEEIISGLRDMAAKEQHTMQLAAISTAAIGYFKDGDSIHPGYDSTALRDVTKMYAKYAELYAAKERSVHGWAIVSRAGKLWHVEPDENEAYTWTAACGDSGVSPDELRREGNTCQPVTITINAVGVGEQQHETKSKDWCGGTSPSNGGLVLGVPAPAAPVAKSAESTEVYPALPYPDKTVYGPNRTADGHYYSAARMREYGVACYHANKVKDQQSFDRLNAATLELARRAICSIGSFDRELQGHYQKQLDAALRARSEGGE